MRLQHLVLLGLLTTSTPASAEEVPSLGGLGWAFVGGWFGQPRGLENALRSTDALGPEASFAATSLTLGGGGGLLFARRFWLGGKGFLVLHGQSEEARGKGTLRAGGGGFELGAALVNDGTSLVIPFLGLGGLGYGLELQASDGQPLAVEGRPLLGAGQKATLQSGFATGEVGARYQRLIFWGHEGLTVGVELGLLTSLNSAPWKRDGQEQQALPETGFTGGFVRFNLGGGGFLFR